MDVLRKLQEMVKSLDLSQPVNGAIGLLGLSLTAGVAQWAYFIFIVIGTIHQWKQIAKKNALEERRLKIDEAKAAQDLKHREQQLRTLTIDNDAKEHEFLMLKKRNDEEEE